MIALLWSACVAHVPRPAPLPDPLPGRPAPPLQVSEATLSNGVTVRAATFPGLQVFEASLTVPVVETDDAPEQDCTRFLGAHARVHATDALDAAGAARAVEVLGVRLSPLIEEGTMGLSATGTVSRSGPILSLFADFARSTAVDRAAHDDTVALYRHWFSTFHADPVSVAGVVAETALWEGTAAEGTCSVETFAEVSAEDTAALLARVWTPPAATVVVAGPWTAAEVVAMLEPTLGTWTAPPGRPLPAPVPLPLQPVERLILVDVPGAPQSQVSAWIPTPPAESPRWPDLAVGVWALGVRLDDRLREREGWTYSAWCRLSPAAAGQAGLSVCESTVVGTATGAALAAIRDELAMVRTERPLTSEELASAVISTRARVERASFAEAAAVLRQDHATGFGIGRQAELMAAWAATDLQRVTDALASEENRATTWIVVGDRATVLPQLEGLGLPIEQRDVFGRPLLVEPGPP